MTLSTQSADVLIIGAGIAGLLAATELQRAGRRVLLLDKGRGIGGRMASRRIGHATFDHGAQFMTSRTPRFAALLKEAQLSGAAVEWCRGFSEHADGHVRWRGKPSMNAFAKHLAAGLDVRLETQVASLRCSGAQWIAQTTAREIFSAGALILTPPVPQSLALLDAGKIPLSPDARARLAAIEYERCLAVMAVLDGPSGVPSPGGFAPADGPIAWIADNQAKGVSAEPAVTIHATPVFSLAHWEEDRAESARDLLAAATEWLSARVQTFQLHAWRYSKPLRVDQQPCAILSEAPPLVLAGDAFAGPRVEGAALSGWASADAILKS